MNPQNKQGQIMEMIFYKPENLTNWSQLNLTVDPKNLTDEEIVASLRIKFDSEEWEFERINSKIFRWNGYLVARWDNNDLDKMKDIERRTGEEIFISDYLESSIKIKPEDDPLFCVDVVGEKARLGFYDY